MAMKGKNKPNGIQKLPNKQREKEWWLISWLVTTISWTKSSEKKRHLSSVLNFCVALVVYRKYTPMHAKLQKKRPAFRYTCRRGRKRWVTCMQLLDGSLVASSAANFDLPMFFFQLHIFLRKKWFVSWCMAGSTMQQRPFLAVACRGPGVSWVAMDVSTVSWLWPRSRLEHGSIMVQGLR